MKKLFYLTLAIAVVVVACKDPEKDPCEAVKVEAGKKEGQYKLYRDSTFNHFMPLVMQVPYYEMTFNTQLKNNTEKDSLDAFIATRDAFKSDLGWWNSHTETQKNTMEGAARTAAQTLTWDEALKQYKKNNKNCF